MDWSKLSNVLWWLLIGALFYWVMRKGGCGMHGSHGGHKHGHDGSDRRDRAEHQRDDATVVDPVCGMRVERDHAVAMRKSSGSAFYLCSSDCLDKFDADPERYTRGTADSRSTTAESVTRVVTP